MMGAHGGLWFPKDTQLVLLVMGSIMWRENGSQEGFPEPLFVSGFSFAINVKTVLHLIQNPQGLFSGKGLTALQFIGVKFLYRQFKLQMNNIIISHPLFAFSQRNQWRQKYLWESLQLSALELRTCFKEEDAKRGGGFHPGWKKNRGCCRGYKNEINLWEIERKK